MSTFSQDNLVSITMQRKIQLLWLHNYKRRLVSTRNKFTRLISVPLNVCTRCFSFHNSHIFNSTAIMHAKRAFSRITCRSLFIYIFNTFLFMAIFTPLISQASGQAYTAPIEATEKSIRPLADCISRNLCAQ